MIEKVSNNVIQFPKQNSRQQEVIALEDITRNVEMMKLYHIQETIANLAPMIFNQLEISGFNISDEETTDIKRSEEHTSELQSH